MSAQTELGEDWRTVLKYEDVYEVSSLGRVRSTLRVLSRTHPKNAARTQTRAYGGSLLRIQNGRAGYCSVGLWRNNKGHTFDVHVLVCEAFFGPRPAGMDVNHIDGDRKNNALYNLEWATRRDNLLHAEKVLGKRMAWVVQKERAAARKTNSTTSATI